MRHTEAYPFNPATRGAVSVQIVSSSVSVTNAETRRVVFVVLRDSAVDFSATHNSTDSGPNALSAWTVA